MAARFVRHVNAHTGLAFAVAVAVHSAWSLPAAAGIPHGVYPPRRALDFTRSANGKATALTAKNARRGG
jgi:hypothetical protein